MGRLDGKVALISGAGPNNGGTIGAMMAKEGAKVVCNDLKPSVAEETADHIRSRGGEAIHTIGDSSDEEHVKAMVKAGIDAFGHVDVLVNLSGTSYHETMLGFNLDHWNHVVKSFLTGAALVMREVANALVAQGRTGSFIIISSDAAYGGQPRRLGYSAVKAGLIMLAKATAMELAYQGIRVNVISPSGMEHNRWRARRQPGGPPPPRERFLYTSQESLDAVPLGRWGRSTDLGHLAIFLASDESEFITGVEIPVDGGCTARYHPWVPGKDRDLTVEEYIKTKALYQRYGETVMGPGVDEDKIPFPSSPGQQ